MLQVLQNNEIANLKKELGSCKAQHESSLSSNDQKENEIKRLLAKEVDLQGQARKLATALENVKASKQVCSRATIVMSL